MADVSDTLKELVAWDFREFVQGDPDVSWRLLQYVVGLLLDAERSSGAGS